MHSFLEGFSKSILIKLIASVSIAVCVILGLTPDTWLSDAINWLWFEPPGWLSHPLLRIFLIIAAIIIAVAWFLLERHSKTHLQFAFGTGRPYETIRQSVHGQFRTVYVAIRNSSAEALSNGKLHLIAIDGPEKYPSSRCPIQIAENLRFNPKETLAIPFAEFWETPGAEGPFMDRRIDFLFKIISQNMNAVTAGEYSIVLEAQAAESLPRKERCKLFINQNGFIRLEKA